MKYFVFVVFSCLLFSANAQVRLPRLIRDSMVLQRETKLKLWGWAAPGEKISIKFNNKNYKVKTGTDGKWMVMMAPVKAGGPYTMTIDASNHIVLKDILIGDVWVCSGQSNMVHQMSLHAERYAEDITKANYPQIRHFWIQTKTDLNAPLTDFQTGYWKAANIQDVRDFSAVAFFFARNLYEQYHIPIGLINASVGGSPIEAWISEDGMKEFPGIIQTINKNKDTAYINGLSRGMMTSNRTIQHDKGLMSKPTWFDTSYIPTHWRPITIPGYWEDQGVRGLDGTVWYRKEIEVPAAMTGIPAKMALGRIVDADVVYVNGKQIGNTTYQYPQRRYPLPVGILKPGKNIIVVRVTNTAGKGGFVPDKPYYITAGKDTLALNGTWLYKVGEVFIPQRSSGINFSAQNSPTALYNAMLAPVTHFMIKGILWYQGEANTGNPNEYAELMPALIKDWRKKWGEGDIPFLYVQLPNFMEVQYLPSESQWAATREAQVKALAVHNTGMAVAIDLGEWNDIHPDRKKEVGDRLSLLARKLAYGEKDLVASGPMFESAKADGNKIMISFTSIGNGLVTNDGEEPSAFAIAGADKKFLWAHARIDGDKVIVWNDTISSPMYVRYAWADNPDNPNLYNKEGLPASPFRSDY